MPARIKENLQTYCTGSRVLCTRKLLASWKDYFYNYTEVQNVLPKSRHKVMQLLQCVFLLEF